MLRSMTGFGTATCFNEYLSVTVDLKTVNSKVLDLSSLRLPSRYRCFESTIRTILYDGIERGKVDLFLTIVWSEGKEPVMSDLNRSQFTSLVNKLKAACTENKLQCHDDAIFQAVMQTEGIWLHEESPTDEELKLFEQALREAILQVNEFREREARATAEDLKTQLQLIRTDAALVDSIKDERTETFRNHLEEELQKLKNRQNIEIDDPRMQQEILYLMQKLDVNEELKRLAEHCRLFEQTLLTESTQGKKLNFIAQEMGREINTLGSKAFDKEIQHCVIRMKDALEKIKEQVLNIL